MSGTGDNNVTIAIKGTVDPSLAASTTAAAAQLDSLNTATATSNASFAQLGISVQDFATKANLVENGSEGLAAKFVGASVVGTNFGQVLSGIGAAAASTSSAIGDVKFSTLQEGIDAAIGLDRNLTSAAASARIFNTSLATNAGFDALTRDAAATAELVAQYEAQQAAAVASAAAGQEITNAYAGVKTEFASAAASGAVFSRAIEPQATQAALATQVRMAMATEAEAAASVGTALTGFGRNAGTAEVATRGLNVATSGMIQEYVRMGRAIATGRFDILPSELATATGRMGGLSATTLAAYGPMIAVGAAVAALAVGLGYLAVKAIEADQALSRTMIGAEFAGNTAITAEGIQTLETELTSLSSMSSATANEVISSYSKMSDMSQASLNALSLATGAYIEMTGEKAPEVVRQFSDLITNQKLTLDDLQKVFPGVTEAEANNFIQVQKLGDAHRTTAALVTLLQTQMESSRQRVIAYNAGWVSLGNDLRLGAGYIQDVIGWLVPLSDGIESGIKLWNETGNAIKEAGGWIQKMTSWIPPLSASERAQNDLLHESAAAYNAQSTAMANAAKQAGASATNKPFVSSVAVNTELQKIADDVSLTDAQILQKQVTYLQQQISLTRENTQIRNELEQEVATRTTELARKTSSDLIETARTTEAMRGEIGKRRIQDEINTDKQLLANTNITAQDKLSVERDMGEKLSELNQKDVTADAKTNKEKLAEHLRELQEEVSATRQGSQERIDAEQRVLDFAVSAYGRLSSEAKSAQDAITTDRRAAMDQEVSDLESVESANIKAADAIAAEKIKSIQEAFRYGQINADEEISQARAVENARDDAAQQGYQVRLALAYGNAAEITRINAEIEAEERLHQKNLTDIDRKGEEDRVAEWKNANSQILSAESSFISSYLSGQKTLGQAALSALGQFLEQQIEAEASAWTERKLLAIEGVAATNATEQGGLISAFLRDREETASAVSNQVIQNNTVIAGQATQLVAKKLGTAGTVTDQATQTATVGAAQAAQTGASVAAQATQTAATATGTAVRTGFATKEMATENSDFIVRAGKWLASELGMTEATTAGAATRTTDTVASIASTEAAQAAANVASAESYAAVAATGAAAAVASIPYVGPVLAAAAAASTFAGLQPYVAIAALEVGAWNLPQGGLYELHAGESVVPKDFASGMRSAGFGASPLTAGAGGGGQSSGGDEYHIHMNTIDGRTGAKFLMDNAGTIVSMLATQKRNSSSLFNTRPT